MSFNTSTTLSTAAQIQDNVKRDVSEFSTVDIMGSLVNNEKFKAGYIDMTQEKLTERSYIWNALSAVSQDLGQALYENVRDYIDNVSNVDTCKVHALKSMMHIVGSEYNVLDKIGYYPIEIQNLIDILSISKKHLLSNKFIKQDFLDALCADGVAQKFTPEQLIDASMSAAALSIDAISSQADYYMLKSDDAFTSYLSSVYAGFIYDMLTMHGTGLCADVQLYKTGFLSGMYDQNAEIEDPYLSVKLKMNVDVNFDVEQVVNDIDIGIDSLDNYSGEKLDLLVEEINRRASPVSGLSCQDLTTRYMYYRKQKVREYAEFVDNMVFLPVNFSSYVEYDYDKNYLTMLSSAKHSTCISTDVSGNPVINEDYIYYAAASLAQITRYISKIRQTIKLQARKIFMKGTNNLLQYTANEFLIDYIQSLKDSINFSRVSSVVEKLSAHNVNDVIVQEYWDMTEYMNLSTSTSKYATNSKLVNERYFDKTFTRTNGHLVPTDSNIFTNAEINNFYLNELNLANTLYPALSGESALNLSSNLYEFLSALFDVAANTAYYNDKYKFGIKLQNDVMTEEIDSDLSIIKSISGFVQNEAASASYSFEESSSLSVQIDGFERAVYSAVQDMSRAGISSTYDTYSPLMQQLSSGMTTLVNDLNTMLTGTYANYFCKSSSIYCYNSDGSYKFDYFVGNSIYSMDDSFTMSSNSAKEWIENDHCYTFSLSAAVVGLSSAYNECASVISRIIQNDLESLDFIDPENADLGAEMDSMQEFVNLKISQRTTYLQNVLQDLKDQAAQAKSEYTTVNSTFSTVLASMPALPHQSFYMEGCDARNGDYVMLDPITGSGELQRSIYDAVSQSRFAESSKYGTFIKVECGGYLDEIASIDSNDTLENQIEKCIAVFDMVGKMSFGPGSTSNRNAGTQKVTLQSLQASLHKISNVSLPSIINQLKTVFNIAIDTSSVFAGKSCIEKIDYVMSFLNTNVSDQQFTGDSVMKRYYSILSELNVVSDEVYISAKSQYEALWTEFESFFIDYSKGSDYRLYVPHNLISIDSYRKTKDAVALNNILEKFDDLNSQYQSMLQMFIDMCNDNSIMLYAYDFKSHRYMYTGESLERCIADFAVKMSNDIAVRDSLASEKAIQAVNQIQMCMNDVMRLYKTYFPYEIQYEDDTDYIEKFNSLSVSLIDVIGQIISKLEYNDEYEYTYSKELFKNYSGMTEIATDPYYNMKNQTHPSYQIHPFMWNFIEWHPYDSVIDQISKTVADLTYDMLDVSNAASTIDKLLGQFGNVIDVWRNNTYDFTGYSTRYEQSNHICQYTQKWNEVVGYEGAFYPPAVEKYVSDPSSDVVSLSSYYDHLNLDKNEQLMEMMNNALSSSWKHIYDIVSPHRKHDVYDIYKMYVDNYDNTYLLYKRYDSDDPSEQDKLSTSGQLWIRLADSPLAFPMSCLLDFSETGSSSRTLSLFNEYGICDICMFEAGQKLVITGYTSKSNMQTKPLYISYDVDESNSGCGIGHLALIATNPYSDSIDQADSFPEYSESEKMMYIGSLTRGPTYVDVVYLSCDSDGNIPDDPNVVIYSLLAENANIGTPINEKLTGLSGIENRIPVMSKHDSVDSSQSYIDLMFVTSRSHHDEIMMAERWGLSAGDIYDAEGYVYNDPVHESMNSFDLMADQLVVKSICIAGQGSSKEISFQTNTDMGYVPSYTYGKYANVLDIKDDLNSSHQMIELLGKSKDIESSISTVNSDANPYMTKKSIFENTMYGRIYEDDGISSYYDYMDGLSGYTGQFFIEKFDKSINIYSNWSMYQNMPNQYVGDYVYNYVNGHYQWTIFLDKTYSYDKMRSLRLYIYTTGSLGKNPYVVAEMSDVIKQSEALPQNEFLSTNYNALDMRITTYPFQDGVFTVTMNGTQNGIDEIDSYFSNALPNISDFKYKYSTLGGGRYLKLDFKLKDVNAESYIEKDIIKVALVDIHDMSLYNWFHFIDPGFTFGDFQHVLNKLSGDPLTKEQLSSIDFSQYSYLSDIQVNGVQIFETSERIQFKAGEDDIFPLSSFNYYVPSLNTKFPMTFAQGFDKMQNAADEATKKVVHIYQPDEVFRVEVTDAELLSALQVVDMNYDDVVDEYRVFEDYFDSSDDTFNNTKFSTDDPFFYQYVHFVSYDSTSSISVSNDSCIDVRIDGTDKFSQVLSSYDVLPRHGEDFSIPGTMSRKFNFRSLDETTKMNVIDHARQFMNLHISYAKSSNGIVLYVNYQNYINSPYIKIKDGQPYMTTIDNTYCKILPGENSLIDIVLQFTQYLNGVLMGVTDVRVATCKIYNVSDDKPKFVIEKISQIQ